MENVYYQIISTKITDISLESRSAGEIPSPISIWLVSITTKVQIIIGNNEISRLTIIELIILKNKRDGEGERERLREVIIIF